MKVLDLFSGIGGFSLGLERAGMRTVRFCEIDSYCQKVLAKHWPDVPCHDDITTMQFKEGEADVICAGFPCQDLSVAGRGAGLAGARSGLFRELVRAIRLVRPRYAILENVAALLSRGMGTVLGELAEGGYDAQWDCIPASSVGAPHRRDRVWIVAHASGSQLRDEPGDDGAQESVADADNQGQLQQGRIIAQERGWLGDCRADVADAACELLDGPGSAGPGWRAKSSDSREDVADAECSEWRPFDSSCGRIQWPDGLSQRQEGPGRLGASGEDVADAIRSGLEGRAADGSDLAEEFPAAERGRAVSDSASQGWRFAQTERTANENRPGPLCQLARSDWWKSESGIRRMAHGIPNRIYRLKALGNAVVPQIPELIGKEVSRGRR